MILTPKTQKNERTPFCNGGRYVERLRLNRRQPAGGDEGPSREVLGRIVAAPETNQQLRVRGRRQVVAAWERMIPPNRSPANVDGQRSNPPQGEPPGGGGADESLEPASEREIRSWYLYDW